MKTVCRAVLAGIGGYGNVYLQELLRLHGEGALELVAAADPDPASCLHLKRLRSLKIPVYPSFAKCLARHEADLAIIAAPVHFHAELTCAALAKDMHVLCEKPLASSMEDIARMEAAEAVSRGRVAVGYQWSFTDPVQRCKADILAGHFGKPLRARTIAASPRSAGYFCRNQWAGRLRTAEDQPVLDSPLHNAHSHHLHHMLYLLGGARENAAAPVSLRAELFRANAIENFDTCALRCETEGGVEILFYATHASAAPLGPAMRMEFERATLSVDGPAGHMLSARLANGEVREYGALCEYPDADYFNKIMQSIEARETGAPPACGLAGATPQALCALAAQRSAREIVAAPPELIEIRDDGADRTIVIKGIGAMLQECWERECLPSELAAPLLSCPGRIVVMAEEFPAAAAFATPPHKVATPAEAPALGAVAAAQ